MTTSNDHFNKDELEAPSWMSREFFTKILQSSEKDDALRLQELHITPASMKGDHFASVMFRASVQYTNVNKETRSKSLVIKTLPEMDGLKKDMLNETFIFETEIAMYTEVIPKFEAMLRAIGDNTVLGARCLYHSLDPVKVIIFEDLLTLGYTMIRDRQTNLEEAKLALAKIAKWHACSYKINQENPAILDEFSHDFMEMSHKDLGNFIGGGIGLFIEMLGTQPTLIKYKHYFEAMQPNLIEKCMATYREYREARQADAHYVLCHGDFHCKNMMFKRSTDDILEDVLFFDFQLCYLGPMINDVIYAIYMLIDRELRQYHKDELIHFYFSHFLETLKRLGYVAKMPTLLEFRQMMLRHAHFEIFLLVTFLPMWYSFEEGITDPEEMLESKEYRKRFYLNKKYIAELEECLPKLLQQGYLGS